MCRAFFDCFAFLQEVWAGDNELEDWIYFVHWETRVCHFLGSHSSVAEVWKNYTKWEDNIITGLKEIC